jgi:1-deoxy-D-xylulose-5-phosphate synthase
MDSETSRHLGLLRRHGEVVACQVSDALELAPPPPGRYGIGDGALSAGMAFEALNHAGSTDLDLMVILNDNEMSISPPVGAITSHLARVLSGSLYTRVREGSKNALRGMPQLRELVGRWEEHMKGMVMTGTLFEELGFSYIGPVDGPDMDDLLAVLRAARVRASGPVLIHVITTKGKGYAPAETAADKYHGVSKFDVLSGKQTAAQSNAPAYTKVFAQGLIAEAEFLDMLRRAAYYSGRTLQVLAVTGAGADHPWLAQVPESRYLKAVFCRVD